MFRIVANGAGLADKNLAPGQPYYASISSAPKHKSGTILTVGRSSKNNDADLIFAKEAKAVSRNHLVLRLVKIGAPTPAGTPDAEEGNADAGGETTEEAEGNAFDKPRNAEEMEACQEAADGIILVLYNTGSLGSVVEYEEPVRGGDDHHHHKKADADEGTDDDETDDEEGSQAAAKAEGKAAAKSSSSNTKLVQHRMEKGESFIVKSLSLPKEKEADGDSHLVCAAAFCSLPAIRVGLGASDGERKFPKVVLEIARVPMNLCVTRIDNKSKTKITKMADELGINVVQSKGGWVTHPAHPLLEYSHLLASSVTSTAKVLSAWCLKKPIVDPDFVFKGLAERKTFWTPMPKESDYSTEGGKDVVTSEAAKAEQIGKGPFLGRRDPLKGFVVVSLAPGGETENLVMAAGGTVYRAYNLDDDAFNSGTWLDELELAQENPIPVRRSSGAAAGGTVVLIETSSKKVKKRKDFLRARNIHAVSQKEFAISITNMKPLLKTTGGEFIKGREDIPSSSFRLSWGSGSAGHCRSVPESTPLPEESEAASLSTIQEVSREDESRNESSQRPHPIGAEKTEVLPAEEPAKGKESEPAKEPELEPAKEPEPVPETNPVVEEPQIEEDVTSRGKRKRGGAASKDQGADGGDKVAAEEPQKATKRTKTGRTSKDAEDEKPRDDEEDDEILAANNQDDDIPSAEAQSTRSKRKRDEKEATGADHSKKKRSGCEASKGQNDENEGRVVEATFNPNERRKPLPKAKKIGWLSAAPKDADERAKYKSTKADLDDIDATFPSEAAITVKKTGLVVRSNEEYQERRAQLMAARGRGPRVVTGRDGKPVKDFKRFRKNAIIRGCTGGISFRSVLPKESERQRQLEQMEREREESMREADALFMGEEAGSIMSFFGKSTTKKKKGSRSRVRR
jgi:hypothetical protein